MRLKKGSIVYEEAKEAEKLGTLKDEGIVYAELAKEAGDPAEDWLKITFDTQALRESSADFAVGYVRYKMVEALTDEEAAELIGELEKDEDARWEKDGKFHVPCVVFEEEEADPEASDVTPEAGSPSESSGATEAERIGRTTASNVNVRSEATTQSERVTTIAEAGTEVVVTGEIEADGAVWYAISYEGYVGYIRSDLMEIVAEDDKAQPVTATYVASARMGTADSAFGDTAEYVGGIVADEYASSTWSLDEDLTVAYVTLLSSALEVGQEASWRVTASGGTTPYTYYYCLFRQDLEDTSNLYTSVSGSILTTTSDTYAFTISEEGRYFLQFRITDANGDSLKFQSPTYETPSEELSAKVQEIVNACAGEGKSDYQKALALHDWLCENASYDDTLTIHDPSGVLLQGTGVCESFALAYQMLLTEAGVENVYVTGTANGGGHAWNMVKLDGEWYHVDVTWDENSTDRYYFGMSTALISRDHAIEDRVPTATATKYNYAMNASDGAFASLNELGGLFEKLPAAQEDFIFYYTGSDDIGAAYREWVLANAGTYGITSYSYMTGSYTRYVSGTKEAQEAPEESSSAEVIEVWYDEGIENQPLKIHATTGLDAEYLYLYLGETLLESWSADDVEIVEYAKCKEWIVEHTFAEPGTYNLWYRASADGVDMNQPYTADLVNIGEADEEELVYGDFSYVLNEEGTGVVIASCLGSEADVVVPDAIGGIPVTEIGNDAFLNNATLTRIALPETVERIGARAFKNCTALCEMN